MAVRTLRYNTFEGRTWKGATFVTDTDALAFCEAAQIYDRNQQKSIVDLVRRLKTAGLWSKMKAIYPFVGGTASSHKWNLKDPRDSDAAFRLSFSGGWTHSANGIQPNGTNGYADSFYNPTNDMPDKNSYHISLYCRTQLGNDSVDMGTSGINPLDIGVDFGNILYCGMMVSAAPYYMTTSNTDGRGYWLNNRISTTNTRVLKNGSLFVSGSNTNTNKPNCKIGIGARIDEDTVRYYSDRQFSFATIGDGLTDTDATNLYNIVDLYQKRLGRAV